MTLSTIGTTQASAGGVIPQVWGNRFLDILRPRIVLANIAARDFEFGEFNKGNTLNIGYPGDMTATDKVAGTLATIQQPANSATVQVTLSQHKTVDFVIEDVARAQASTNLMDFYMESAVNAVANALEDYLWSLYSSMTLTPIGTAGTDITKALVFSARQALNAVNAPDEDRHFVMSVKDETALLNDASLAQYFAYAQNQALQNGEIGKLAGFTLHRTTRVPTTGSSPVATHNLALQKNAILLACRPLPAPEPGAIGAVINDPESGLSIRLQFQNRIDYRGIYVALDILYGGVALRPNQGVVVLS